MAQLINEIRYYHFISHVLEGQRTDPLCGICKAYANTVARVEEGFAELESAHAGEISSLPADMANLLAEIRTRMAAIAIPENSVGQKKAGNCVMPEGVCFIKISKAIAVKL